MAERGKTYHAAKCFLLSWCSAPSHATRLTIYYLKPHFNLQENIIKRPACSARLNIMETIWSNIQSKIYSSWGQHNKDYLFYVSYIMVVSRVTRCVLVDHRHSFAPCSCRTSQYRRTFFLYTFFPWLGCMGWLCGVGDYGLIVFSLSSDRALLTQF